MRLKIFLPLLFLSVSGFSQHKIYGKVNAATLPVLVLNAGLEFEISPHFTAQTDFLFSPWKSISGNHAQICMGHLEGRYYFTESFHKWFIGANAGTGVFDITKWNYKDSNKFQRGFAVMAGVSGGYQFRISSKMNGEAFVRFGTVQSFYHGYEYDPPSFTRYDKANAWNKSGEFLPYGGGFMLTYQLQ